VAWATRADPAELLDIDVQQLARPLALVAIGRLGGLEPGELAEPDPGQDALHRGERHPERRGDLGASQAHPPQGRDRLDPILRRRACLASRGRGTIGQSGLALLAVATHPLARRDLAHLGGLGRLAERPTPIDYPPGQPKALLRCERRVTVELHPVTSMGLGGFDTPSLQGGPDDY
jgi:hypothetical protein